MKTTASNPIKQQSGASDPNLAIFLRNNESFLRRLQKIRWLLRCNPRFRALYAAYDASSEDEEKNRACAAILDAFQETLPWHAYVWIRCWMQDAMLLCRQFGKRTTIDRSDRTHRDTYSVAVIVKNEARSLREWILFYRATGTERIYLYDNDSTDGLLDTIAPFIKTGFVVYRRWPGKKVQAAAYRDAIRRSRRRTKWLALIDADEFLFSPRGDMREQLMAYAAYPGVIVSWLLFGPNGHDRRPEGLVMDRYTTRVPSPDSPMNCHAKSIVQPRQVFCMYSVHYALYRGRQYAVNERKEISGNYSAFIEGGGRAFTATNYRDVFRINHYSTKSLEDLEQKCKRGYPDGTPNAVLSEQLRPFAEPLIEDATIRPYADAVRKEYPDRTAPTQ